VRVASQVVFRVAAFLVVAGLVYAVTSHERAGGALILATAVCLAYVGWILRAAVRGARPEAQEADTGPKDAEAETEHVGPTIWPFAFSLAAIGLVLGIALARWLLFVGAALFVMSAVGWFVDIRRQHSH
jgi:Cytochrome c oxidase subunit IV